MYRNAKAEMVRAGLTLEKVALIMKLSITTLSMKLNGKTIVTVDEAKLFKKIVGTDMPLDELFEDFEEVG